MIDKKDRESVKQIKAAINACIADNAQLLGKVNLDRLPKNFNYPLRDGDTEKESADFEGMYFLNAYSENRKPGVVDKNREEITDPDEIYSGAYGRADINFYAYSVSGNKGVAVSLNNIQKVKDGERLDGRVSAEDAFDDGFEFDDEDIDGDDEDDFMN